MFHSMHVFFLSFVLGSSFVHATTTVAVLEFGKGGVIRRITSASPVTSVAGVSSFWNAVHDEIVLQDAPANNKKKKTYNKKKVSRRTASKRVTTQYPGMTMVPDLFKRARGGLVMGISGMLDMSVMPTLTRILKGQDEKTVGQFHVQGSHLYELMQKAGMMDVTAANAAAVATTKISTVQDTIQTKVSLNNNQLDSILVTVQDTEEATQFDQHLASILNSLQTMATESDSTLLLHLVLDQQDHLDDKESSISAGGDDVSSHNNNHHRRLNNNNNNQQQNKNNNNNQNSQQQQQAQYLQKYGYGAWAYTQNNQFYTNVRTIFQIQYFNIVLWTALGLVLVLFVVISMMIHMPFMPDTLLFGESAKMVAE